MASRQAEYAKRERIALIKRLGGVCKHCGEDRIDKLEVDHINGRCWVLKDFSSSARVARYKREEKRKKLQVLCADCNKAKHWANGEVKPESINPADVFDPDLAIKHAQAA